jgi:DNA-directed RNA polymerase specialized sigma24 family protein
MASGALNLENPRDLLARAIAEEIRSWPQRARQIFTQVHYGGMPPEEVAAHFGISKGEINRSLRIYERKLRTALQFCKHIR